MKKVQGKFITLELCKNLKSLGGCVGEKGDNGGHNKINYQYSSDRSMTYTQAPKACEKNIFTYLITLRQWKIALYMYI